jgi:hypothetical protein
MNERMQMNPYRGFYCLDFSLSMTPRFWGAGGGWVFALF